MPRYLLVALVCAAATPLWKEVDFDGKRILLHPKCEPLGTSLLGPFVKLRRGCVLAVDADRVLRWDQAKGGPQPGCRLPVYVTRSTDEGKTWSEPELVQDGYCGALRCMIQLRSGRVVLGCQQAVANPGRHVCFTYVSDDEGRTWKRSNVIDLGKYGGYGDHGGGIEPTLAELHDGRLWMLIRTYRGCFTEAFSDDGGLTWKEIGPAKIEASGSPGQLRRLQSGRLVLFWNRFIDKAKRTGRREQLSMAFSEDDFLPRRPSDRTYQVRYVPAAEVRLDGRDDDPAWSQAAVEKRFLFPWKEAAAPPTEFRALCDDAYLYFTFRVHDEDIFVLEALGDEEDAVFEDRVELYFVRDERMREYYCVEVDSRGRHFDYRGSYYRRFDPEWNWKGLETKGSAFAQGYVVEGRIPRASFEALGFPRLRPGVKIRGGLYRAEFSHDRSGRPAAARQSIHNLGRRLDGPPPVEAWMSWIDPGTEEPDFHVPTSLGWLEIVE